MSWLTTERGSPMARLERNRHTRDMQRAWKLYDYYDGRFLGFFTGEDTAREHCAGMTVPRELVEVK